MVKQYRTSFDQLGAEAGLIVSLGANRIGGENSSFALQEATLVLAKLVQRFDIALARGAGVWPLQKITLRPAHGLPMRIGPRSTS